MLRAAQTIFWTDRWLHDSSLLDLAPAVVTCVSKRSIMIHTVAEALEHQPCVRDIQGVLSMEGLLQCLQSLGCPGKYQFKTGGRSTCGESMRQVGPSHLNSYIGFSFMVHSLLNCGNTWKSWAPSKYIIFTACYLDFGTNVGQPINYSLRPKKNAILAFREAK